MNQMTRSRPLSNLCGVPPWVISSAAFNTDPQPLEIEGVRSAHRRFFRTLDTLDTWEARATAFQNYMDESFHLDQWRGEGEAAGPRSLKNSYLRFLRGWLYDSNSVEGAVLKGWVESRLGIPPTFHKARITGPESAARQGYLSDRMKGAEATNAIFSQLDLLYSFVQHELVRRHPSESHLTLYRGVQDFAEHDIVAQKDRKQAVIRLNNLNSFTRDFERAWEFGTRVIQARVPLPKIFFDGDFLHAGILRGEEEVMVIGGEYHVTVRYY